MSVERITKIVNLCRCELPDCPSKGEPWESRDEKIPARCPSCGRHSWNGQDKRTWKRVMVPPDTPDTGRAQKRVLTGAQKTNRKPGTTKKK